MSVVSMIKMIRLNSASGLSRTVLEIWMTDFYLNKLIYLFAISFLCYKM